MQIELGFWMDHLYNDQWCLPQELPLIAPREKLFVLKFLRNGLVAETYRGYSWCRFGCDAPAEVMGDSDLINGVWKYPQGLAHYIEAHDVAMPPAFVAAVLGNSTDLHETLWADYCRNHFNPEVRGFIDAERRRIDREKPERMVKFRTRIEEQRGLSNVTCIWKNCTNFALSGIQVCAIHGSFGFELDEAHAAFGAFNKIVDFANALRAKPR